LTFLAPANGYRRIVEGAHDAPLPMAIPLIVLSFGSIFIGWLSKDRFLGAGTGFWSNALFTHPERLALFDGEFLPSWIKLTPVILSIISGSIAVLYYTGYIGGNLAKLPGASRVTLFTFLNRKWLFDARYGQVAQSALNVGYHQTYKSLDRGVFELVGPHGISTILWRLTSWVLKLQTGHIYHYGLVRLRGVLRIGYTAQNSFIF
jgi:NADH:ubiquinone oxidoreductase subunit 5 (subunit L)/multisubunit Na+/H+ antiporter MnhA subunit